MNNKKYSIDMVKDSFEKEGYTLLSTEYRNTKQKLKFVCDNGHHHHITWQNWNVRGQRCGKCSNKHLTVDDIRKAFDEEGYTLLSDEYVGAYDKLDFVCPNGHEYNMTWNSWQQRGRCGRCHGNKLVTYDQVKQSFTEEGYVLLSQDYINNKDKLNYICPDGHKHSINWHDWNSGRRCGVCDLRVSKLEKEVQEYVKSLGLDFVENDRTTILNKETGYYLELDLWFPQFNKAIEFNGDYWHSAEEIVRRDQYKKKECERLGVNLLVVRECEWMQNNDQAKNKICGFMGVPI